MLKMSETKKIETNDDNCCGVCCDELENTTCCEECGLLTCADCLNDDLKCIICQQDGEWYSDDEGLDCAYCNTINARVRRERRFSSMEDVVKEIEECFDPKPMYCFGTWYCFECYNEKYGEEEEEE